LAVQPPLDELIQTVLSQSTSDVNTERAFASLRNRFQTWGEVAQAPEHEVADAIRSGGLANIKASRIQCILRSIYTLVGSYDLDFLRDLPDDEATTWLTGLPGVGPKTAACVLLFSLGKPAMPVDTHVHRVARRLGLVHTSANAKQTQPLLEAVIPPPERYTAHLLLIEHGRRTCHARRPACQACAVVERCPSAVDVL
jgi:endonuclease-3